MKNNGSGFTLIELLVVLAIIGIMAAIALPDVIRWVNEDGIRSASKRIYSDMQLIKISAIKENRNWIMQFIPSKHKYYIFSSKGKDNDWSLIDTDGSQPIIKEVILTDNEVFKGNVDYGNGMAKKNATVSGGSFPFDNVSYSSGLGQNILLFNSRGTCTAGYVYIHNKYRTTYAIGTRSSGVILLRKWVVNKWK